MRAFSLMFVTMVALASAGMAEASGQSYPEVRRKLLAQGFTPDTRFCSSHNGTMVEQETCATYPELARCRATERACLMRWVHPTAPGIITQIRMDMRTKQILSR